MVLSTIVFLVAASAVQSYRLPTYYRPQEYDLNLNLPSDVFTTANATAYSGSVAITFTSSSDNINKVFLHASKTYLNIKSVSVMSGETSIGVTEYSVNSTTDILTVSLASSLTINQAYIITLVFDGKLSNSDMYGFYKSSYTDSFDETYYLATQMAPTYARRVFPCFDEPSYKAKFNISLTYHSGLNVLSNADVLSTNMSADNATLTTVFNPTPVMSTYLVAFTVSKFTCSHKNLIEGKLPFQVCSRNDTSTVRDLALEVAPLVINSLNSYLNIHYSANMPKLDLVAIPDMAYYAMENWGLVTFRERALLYDANETSNRYKQYVVTDIVHELAHQWFGNLVTCKWWSETFLHKGFATYFEHLITDEIYPKYQMNKQFVIKNLQYILEEDASSTEALRANVSKPSEISDRFRSISYDKGGSIIRMVKHLFSNPDLWKTQLRLYLNQFAYSSAEPNDLWTALVTNVSYGANFPADNLSIVMENWINYPGYPLVTVSRNKSLFTFSQKRFVYNNRTATNTSWYIPMSYADANDPAFDRTFVMMWLKPSTNLVTYIFTRSWLIINTQQSGFYRVNYDSGLWAALSTALLQRNFSGIPEINRAQIVDDTFNLARGGYLNYSQIFNITRFLANDTSYFVWYPAFNGFDYILKRFGENSTLGESVMSHILTLSKSFIASAPITKINDDDHIYSLKQELAQTWSCRLGDTTCIGTALQLFATYKNTSIRPPKNLRSIVYSYGLKHSTNISADWDFLWNEFLNTTLPSEQFTILFALGSTSEKTILNSFLQKTLTDNSGIRLQDYAAVFTAVYSGSAVGVDVALDFWNNNYNAIIARYTSSDGGMNILKGLAREINTKEQMNKLQNFTLNNTLTGSLLEAANAALSLAQDNYEYVNTYRSGLYSYYQIEEPSSSTPPPMDNSARKPFVTLGVMMIGLICITS